VLEEVLGYVRPGDTLVVWRLDRLGRSLQHLIAVVAQFAERGIGFKSLTEQIDTTTPGGKLIFHVFGALAEFERDLIRERTQTGLAAVRARGRLGGRPKKLTEGKQRELARALPWWADRHRHHLSDAGHLPGHPVPGHQGRCRPAVARLVSRCVASEPRLMAYGDQRGRPRASRPSSSRYVFHGPVHPPSTCTRCTRSCAPFPSR